MKAYDVVTVALTIGAAAGAMLLASPDCDASPNPSGGSSIQEDDPGWNCMTMGDQVCGPGNSNKVAPGWYVNGVIFQPWPTVNDCRNVGGAIYCEQYYVDPSQVVFSNGL